MKTILSFQDESHRVQLVEDDLLASSMQKHVIYDNRRIIKSFFADISAARRYFYNYIGNIILQSSIMF